MMKDEERKTIEKGEKHINIKFMDNSEIFVGFDYSISTEEIRMHIRNYLNYDGEIFIIFNGKRRDNYTFRMDDKTVYIILK